MRIFALLYLLFRFQFLALGFKVIKPDKYNIRGVLRELLKGIRVSGKKILADFEKTTATWTGETPTFKAIIKRGFRNTVVTIVVSGTEKAVNKWFWLNDGTSVRFATMTRNFSPKTQPRVVGSRTGSGGLLYVNKAIPRPGIEAREWTVEIAKKWDVEFRVVMVMAMENAAKASGHAIP